MLNGYFAFGVPIFLLLLYLFFEWVRKKFQIRYYIGFILFLIASFLTVFSFQVLQEFWSSENAPSSLGYTPKFLWLPLAIGILLILLNSWRGIKRVVQFQSEKKQRHQ